MKVFISQKMRDLSEEEILKRKQMLIDLTEATFDNKIEVIESWHPDFDKNSVAQLGRSIIEMSDADLVLLSMTSINNIEEFMDTSVVDSFKGSEFEAMICASYDLTAVVYAFTLDDNGNAVSVKWIDENYVIEDLIGNFIE